MRIITVNLPVKDIKTIVDLVGEDGLYPSRSELIRVAIRDFLVKELHVAKSFFPHVNETPELSSDKNLVHIPDADSFRTFKIVPRKVKANKRKDPTTEINTEPDVNLIIENGVVTNVVRKYNGNGNPLGNKFHPNGAWQKHHC